MKVKEVPLLAKVAIIGTLTLSGVTYYVVEGPSVPQPEPTASAPAPEPSPSQEPKCDPPCLSNEVCKDRRCVIETPPPSNPPPTASPCPCGQRETGECRPCPSPTPSPSPSSSPSATPPPSPSPSAPPSGGCITFGDAACLSDDPLGLMRAGDGRNSKGGSGTGAITVTALGPDGAVGTLGWAFGQISATKRRVVCAPGLVGDVPGAKIKWNKPLTTLDMSACDVRVLQPCAGAGCERILVGATHDVIVYGVRGEGTFNETSPPVPINQSSVLTLEGDMVPVQYPWDTEPLAGGNRRVLVDRSSVSRVQDDGLAVWCGAEDVSILRSFISRSWHPSTAGCNGVKPPGDPKERRRVTWAYNVWYRNGARQIRALEGLRDWTFVGNILAAWVRYVSPSGAISPNGGLWLEDNAGGESDRGYIVGNLAIPGSDTLLGGCFVGSEPGCDAGGSSASSDYARCNPKMISTRWFFSANAWGGSQECVTNPPGYVRQPRTPAAPKLDEARPWSTVLAEAGVPKRRADEQADLDWIAARLPQ